MMSEMVDPINWSHPPPSWTVTPGLHVLHSVNGGYKSQDFLQQPGLEHAPLGMPHQRTACAATQGGRTLNEILLYTQVLVSALNRLNFN